MPDLKTTRNAWHDRYIVGISGAIAAGKTTAATALRERGFAYARYSEVLADLLRGRGREVDRRALQEIGEEVHSVPGQRWLSEQLLARIPMEAKLVVVDGLRFPDDHAFFAERYGPNFIHCHVQAPREARRDRYLSMGFSEVDFELVTSHPVERGVPALAKLAHVQLNNASSLEAFRARVVEAIAPVEKRAVV